MWWLAGHHTTLFGHFVQYFHKNMVYMGIASMYMVHFKVRWSQKESKFGLHAQIWAWRHPQYFILSIFWFIPSSFPNWCEHNRHGWSTSIMTNTAQHEYVWKGKEYLKNQTWPWTTASKILHSMNMQHKLDQGWAIEAEKVSILPDYWTQEKNKINHSLKQWQNTHFNQIKVALAGQCMGQWCSLLYHAAIYCFQNSHL